MNRRSLLAAAGAAGLSGLAGCTGVFLGDGSQSLDCGTDGMNLTPTQADESPDDGYPPPFESVPESGCGDPSAFETRAVPAREIRNANQSMEVKLAPIEAVVNWYARGEARIADARGQTSYTTEHVLGAVSSPAGAPLGSAPTSDWPTGDRVVTYCACPHHLSSIRAAELKAAGFETVYALDDGFLKWKDRDYPLGGQNAGATPSSYTIDGVVDPAHAGGSAWARHEPSGQREVTDIASDGSYALGVHFYDVTESDELTIETPEYTVTKPIADLVDGRVTGE